MELFVVIWFILFFWIIGNTVLQWVKNENSPALTGPATIVDLRRKTHHHHHPHSHSHSHSYYVTFEKDGAERIELKVKRHEYKEMVIGDRGILTHQGTRYQGFERTSTKGNENV